MRPFLLFATGCVLLLTSCGKVPETEIGLETFKVLVRGIERTAIVFGGIVSIVLGTLLFKWGIRGKQSASGGLGDFKFHIGNAAPGTMLALFGMAILCMSLFMRIEIDRSYRHHPVTENESIQVVGQPENEEDFLDSANQIKNELNKREPDRGESSLESGENNYAALAQTKRKHPAASAVIGREESDKIEKTVTTYRNETDRVDVLKVEILSVDVASIDYPKLRRAVDLFKRNANQILGERNLVLSESKRSFLNKIVNFEMGINNFREQFESLVDEARNCE